MSQNSSETLEAGRQAALDGVREAEVVPGPRATRRQDLVDLARTASAGLGHAMGRAKITDPDAGVVDERRVHRDRRPRSEAHRERRGRTVDANVTHRAPEERDVIMRMESQRVCVCGHHYDPERWATLSLCARLTAEQVSSLVTLWPSHLVVEVRVCAGCKRQVSRLSRATSAVAETPGRAVAA